MTRLLVFVLITGTVLAACSKDKFQTRPSLELKSVNGDTFSNQNDMNIEFEFTDKEGDVNDTLFMLKKRINTIQVETLRDTVAIRIPDFPKNNQGFIRMRLSTVSYLESAQRPPVENGNAHDDTLMIRFALKDKAGNVSDTVVLGPVYIIR